MTLNTILINFDSVEEMNIFLENTNLECWESSEDELWAEFEIRGYKPNELCFELDSVGMIVNQILNEVGKIYFK